MQRLLKNLIPVVLGFLILAGCATTQETDYTPVERPNLVLPEVGVLNLRSVKWQVVTPDNASEVFMNLREDDIKPVIVGVPESDYKNILMNVNDLRSYIERQKSVINAYERYYQGAEDEFDRIEKE